jgi:hypothetical protein
MEWRRRAGRMGGTLQNSRGWGGRGEPINGFLQVGGTVWFDRVASYSIFKSKSTHSNTHAFLLVLQ